MPKEKSAVFCRFLSLCPQFDPYLLGGCDGGGAVHKKGGPPQGGGLFWGAGKFIPNLFRKLSIQLRVAL